MSTCWFPRPVLATPVGLPSYVGWDNATLLLSYLGDGFGDGFAYYACAAGPSAGQSTCVAFGMRADGDTVQFTPTATALLPGASFGTSISLPPATYSPSGDDVLGVVATTLADFPGYVEQYDVLVFHCGAGFAAPTSVQQGAAGMTDAAEFPMALSGGRFAAVSPQNGQARIFPISSGSGIGSIITTAAFTPSAASDFIAVPTDGFAMVVGSGPSLIPGEVTSGNAVVLGTSLSLPSNVLTQRWADPGRLDAWQYVTDGHGEAVGVTDSTVHLTVSGPSATTESGRTVTADCHHVPYDGGLGLVAPVFTDSACEVPILGHGTLLSVGPAVSEGDLLSSDWGPEVAISAPAGFRLVAAHDGWAYAYVLAPYPSAAIVPIQPGRVSMTCCGKGIPLRQRQRTDGLTTGASRVRAGANQPSSLQSSLRQRGYS